MSAVINYFDVARGITGAHVVAMEQYRVGASGRTKGEWVQVITDILVRKGVSLEVADHAAREIVQELLNSGGVIGGGR